MAGTSFSVHGNLQNVAGTFFSVNGHLKNVAGTLFSVNGHFFPQALLDGFSVSPRRAQRISSRENLPRARKKLKRAREPAQQMWQEHFSA